MSHGIHWDLYLPTAAAPNDLLEELRTYLWTQRFSYVGSIIHRIGNEADFNTLSDTDPDRYPMIVARRLLFLGSDLQQPNVSRVQDLLPLEAHAYSAFPVPAANPPSLLSRATRPPHSII